MQEHVSVDASFGADAARELRQHRGEQLLAAHRVQRGDARVLAVGGAEPDVGLERLEDLALEPHAEGLAGEAPEEGLSVHAPGGRAVALGSARCPHRLLAHQRALDGAVVVEVEDVEGLVDRRQPGPVVEQRADRDVFLAVPSEGRPVVGDGLVEIELAPVFEHQEGNGAQALGGAEDHPEGVVFPGAFAVAVGDAGPEVDHQLALAVRGKGGTHLVPVFEVGAKRVEHGLETRCDVAVDRQRHGGSQDCGLVLTATVRCRWGRGANADRRRRRPCPRPPCPRGSRWAPGGP